jgi:NAD(P)-dependent dehydrogenase (short-subunit alcohol dehydrogenase family)
MPGTRHEAEGWSADDAPDQSGRVAVVTGASSGIGLETARVLASKGAVVVLACRDMDKATKAAEVIRTAITRPSVEIVQLDLASLASVRTAATAIRSRFSRLDLLINNAGVMNVPYQRTEDGFESTFAINHLGHFAFTGLLLDLLLTTDHSRIVTVSSLAHRRGVMHFDDLQLKDNYRPGVAYEQSKLANLLFTYELERRLTSAGAHSIALAAHPGIVRTDLWRTSSGVERLLVRPSFHSLTRRLVQTSDAGALPILRAALDPAAHGGEYYGPGRPSEYTGRPVRVESTASSHDHEAQLRLWDESERLTQVSYSTPPAGSPAHA